MISTTSAAHSSSLHSPLQLNSKPDPNTYPGRNVPNFRSFRSCFCGARSSDSANVADRDPILLVSGIAGSILNSKSKKTGSETRVWIRILLADLEFRRKLWSIYNPEPGYTESLDDDTEILVPQDDYGLYAIDILDPSTMLVGCGYEKGTTLFGYGYDFRQSNRIGQIMDGLKEKLETAHKASGEGKLT